MPTGDYVQCPLCNNFMIYGNVACTECLIKTSIAPSTFLPPLNSMNDEKTLNELVDDVIGVDNPSKKSPKDQALSEVFEKFIDPPKQILPNEYTSKDTIKKETLVVNLFAGAGAGKSTTCSGIFFDLKNLQIDCEIASEYAKDLVWEKRNYTFEDQIYLFAKQYHRIFRLLGQVDVVITDSPILLSPVYDNQHRSTLEKLVVEEHNKMWTYNVFLRRKKKYNPVGRIHNEQQAHELDRKILNVLDKTNQCYEVFDASKDGKDAIVKKILLFLNNKPSTLKKRIIVDFDGDCS